MIQSISIKSFDKNNNFLGTFKISYGSDKNSKRSSLYYSKVFNHAKSDMDIILNNIKTDSKLDDKTPIQYSKSCSDDFSNIFLLEETNYTLSFESENNIFSNDEIFFTLRNEFERQPLNMIDTHNKKFFTGLLNFHSYVGKTFLDIKKDNRIITSIPLEVKSKKINYQEEYPAMIGDLSKHLSSLIFDSRSPLFQSFELIDSNRTSFYENFMYLEYLFRDENLPYVFEYLSRNLYSQLEEYRESTPTSLVSYLGPNEMTDIFSNPENLYKTHNDESFLSKKMEGYVPVNVNEIKFKDNIDVPENRFYKNFLLTVDYLIEKLLDMADEGYVKDKLLGFSEEINYYLSENYFRDISPMDYEPLNSQVLQKREGYREILYYFLMLEFSYRMKYEWDDMKDTFRGYEKKLSELYEIWVYFELLSVLEELTNHDLHADDLFYVDNFEIKLKKGMNSTIKSALNIDDIVIPIELMYNRTFKGGNGSYSVNLKPDYTFKFKTDNKWFLLHFDAKYKFNINNLGQESYNDIDIYKMHTYKDAIKNTLGSYVLYPGEVKKLFPDNENGLVGAFPLNPGNNESEKENLCDFIYNFIKNRIKK